MQPDWIRKMSKRDKARHEFVMKYRHRLTVENSVRHTVEQHLEWLEDAKEGRAHLRDMKYAQLVEEINKDQQLLQYVEKPLVLYQDEKAALAEIQKEQQESLKQVKKVVYPFWTIAMIFNSLLLIGYYYQDKQIMKGQARIDQLEKFNSYNIK